MIHLDGRVERLVNNNEDANVDPWEITNGAKGYNSVSRHIVYVGGGASVMKRYGRTKGRNIQYVTDVKANAIGYRYLADNIG